MNFATGRDTEWKSVCVSVLWRERSDFFAVHVIGATKGTPPADYMHSNQAINPSLPYTRAYIHTIFHHVPIRSLIQNSEEIHIEKNIHMNMSISETDRLTAHTYRHRPDDRLTGQTQISTRQIDRQVV